MDLERFSNDNQVLISWSMLDSNGDKLLEVGEFVYRFIACSNIISSLFHSQYNLLNTTKGFVVFFIMVLWRIYELLKLKLGRFLHEFQRRKIFNFMRLRNMELFFIRVWILACWAIKPFIKNKSVSLVEIYNKLFELTMSFFLEVIHNYFSFLQCSNFNILCCIWVQFH